MQQVSSHLSDDNSNSRRQTVLEMRNKLIFIHSLAACQTQNQSRMCKVSRRDMEKERRRLLQLIASKTEPEREREALSVRTRVAKTK
jgi:hypothetical protein